MMKNSMQTLFLLLLSAQVLSAAATEQTEPYYHKALSMRVEQVSNYHVQRQFVGRVQAGQIASVGFEQNGKLAQLFTDAGEHVAKGALLAQQDTKLLSIERDELNAQQAEIRARLELVAANLKRLRSLKQKGYTSTQSLDELTAEQKVLRASRNRVKAALNANQIRIEKSQLFAPFDAVVSQRLVHQGEVITAGTPVFKLLQTGATEVQVGIPVRLLSQVQATEDFSVLIGGHNYPVTLITKGSDVDPITRTVQLRLALPDTATAYNGQLAYLNLPETYDDSGFWIPLTALTDGLRGLWNIYVLADTEDSDIYTLKRRNVDILYATQQQAYVRGALQNGERVLTSGLQRLVPGQQVRSQDNPQFSHNDPSVESAQ